MNISPLEFIKQTSNEVLVFITIFFITVQIEKEENSEYFTSKPYFCFVFLNFENFLLVHYIFTS